MCNGRVFHCQVVLIAVAETADGAVDTVHSCECSDGATANCLKSSNQLRLSGFNSVSGDRHGLVVGSFVVG